MKNTAYPNVPQARLGGFFKKAGNLFGDYGRLLLDGAGRPFGFDLVSDDSYKTKIGKSASHFNAKISDVSGAIGKSALNMAVPGMGNLLPNSPSTGTGNQQQPSNNYNQTVQQNNGAGDMSGLMSFMTPMFTQALFGSQSPINKNNNMKNTQYPNTFNYQQGGDPMMQQMSQEAPQQEEAGGVEEIAQQLGQYVMETMQEHPSAEQAAGMLAEALVQALPFEQVLPALAEVGVPEEFVNELGEAYMSALEYTTGGTEDPEYVEQQEVPAAKNGMKVKKYFNGGSVFSKDLVANEDSKAKSFLSLPLMVPIQTEVKETIVLPTGDLVKTNATKRHSKMSDNEVTDIVPEGSYILSQFGDTKIYKSEADQIPLEMQALPYNTYKASKVPTVKTLGDLMGKKKVMAPADLSRKVENKFKIIDSEDPFTKQTNLVNQYNRASYLQAIIGLSEFDKARKGIDNSIETQMSQNMVPQMVAKNGGKVMAGYPLKNFSVGGIAAIVQGILGATQYFVNRSDAKKGRNIAKGILNNFEPEGVQHINNASGVEVLSNMLQETEVKPQRFGSQFLDQGFANSMASINSGMRTNVYESFMNRMDTSSMSPQMANLLGSKDNSARYEALSKGASDMAKIRADLFNKYMAERQSIYDNDTNSRINARNASNVSRNQVIGNIGASLSGRETNLLNLKSNLASTRVGIETGYVSNLNNASNQFTQSLNNALATGVQAYNSSQQTTNQQAFDRGSYHGMNPGNTPPLLPPFSPLSPQNPSVDCRFGINIRTGKPC